MRIVIAPNAFKGSLSANDAAQAIKAGVNHYNPEIETVCVPIADGGDGFLQVLKNVLNGNWITAEVKGPLGHLISASFLHVPDKSLAVIELASAAGLALLNDAKSDIRKASTYGVGELIAEALKLEVNHLILGIGGSATNDAAMGIASALGIVFNDKDGGKLKPSAENLIKIRHIDTSGINQKLSSIRFDVVCDVKNPLLGANGAAAVFAPQKGATKQDIIFLEEGLSHFAEMIESKYKKNIREIEGGGAAGGVGAGLSVFFNANLCRGAELVLELLSIQQELKSAALLITAEGKFDFQTCLGKAPFAVAKLAKKYSIPVVMIAGQVDLIDWKEPAVFDHVISLSSEKISNKQAISHAASLLQKTVEDMLNRLDFLKREN